MALKNFNLDSAQFKSLLQDQGIYEALRFINSTSVHRFTALYAIEGPILRNICLVDKEDEAIRQMDSIKVVDSYCLYVRNSNQKFITPNSLEDPRVAGHPKQASIQSYCGIPLVSARAMLGTLCHFDFVPLAYTEDEVLLLEMISPILVAWLENNSKSAS
jgi:GAF domain-containing protein